MNSRIRVVHCFRAFDFHKIAAGLLLNFLYVPNYYDPDASLTKAFGLPMTPVLGEDAKFEFRVDAFNLFNTVNINAASIVNSISATNFGQATSALGSRTLDLQARFSF
jgi:hypothetical protein